ncbi:hypothetical protein PRZ48_005431 [Zasmidium cellare]|uniref:Glutathione S-transferase n=1 Tax=Zasmidium cellare TaxID=395010 RepID=A0ABR0ESR8_ZASCE|nr:hypothetical protein PRZ48_005431 [Zasmidium cellare]
MSTPTPKLIYPAPFPGRGEHIRLLLEESGTTYTEGTIEEFQALKSVDSVGDKRNTPLFAPPFLQYGDLTINQTPNILLFLAQKFNLAGDPSDPHTVCRLNGLVLTALDGFSDEIHGCHHPLGGNFYYEDMKAESLARSKDYVKNRLPLFLGYFQRVLKGEASGEGPWLHAGMFTYADLTLFSCLSGTRHQFPKAFQRAEESGKYDLVFKLYKAVHNRPRIKAYLESERRRKYGNGIYRHYPELDVDPEV